MANVEKEMVALEISDKRKRGISLSSNKTLLWLYSPEVTLPHLQNNGWQNVDFEQLEAKIEY